MRTRYANGVAAWVDDLVRMLVAVLRRFGAVIEWLYTGIVRGERPVVGEVYAAWCSDRRAVNCARGIGYGERREES